MKKLILRNDFRENQSIITIIFQYDYEIKELVKRFPCCNWDNKKKLWWISYSDERIIELITFFKDKVWLDYNEFKKVVGSVKFPDLPKLDKLLGEEVGKFENWMRNKRYSESTVKTYKESIIIFLRFLEIKEIHEIINNDLERFNSEYILFKGYSSSNQNQVVNGIKLFFKNRRGIKFNPEIVYRPKTEKTLPNVLSKECNLPQKQLHLEV